MAKVLLSNYKKSWTKERREKQRQRRLGKKWSALVRSKISKANKGQVPWSKGRDLANERPDIGKRISAALKGKKHPWAKGKTYEQIYGKKKAAELRKNRAASQLGRVRPAWVRKKLVEIRSKRIIPFKDTRPELAVKAFLKEHKFRFKQHGLIKNCSHQFDFLISALKLAIEVDGCWWHGCRKCNQEISQAAREQRARDRWWEKKAKKVGWRVVRILEHDTRASKFAVLCEALGIVRPLKEVPCGKGASIG